MQAEVGVPTYHSPLVYQDAFQAFHRDLDFVRKFLKPLLIGELAPEEPSQDRGKNVSQADHGRREVWGDGDPTPGGGCWCGAGKPCASPGGATAQPLGCRSPSPPRLAASLADPHVEEFIPSLSTSGQWAWAGQRVVPFCPCVLRGQPHLPLTSMPAPPLLEADEEAASPSAAELGPIWQIPQAPFLTCCSSSRPSPVTAA